MTKQHLIASIRVPGGPDAMADLVRRYDPFQIRELDWLFDAGMLADMYIYERERELVAAAHDFDCITLAGVREPRLVGARWSFGPSEEHDCPDCGSDTTESGACVVPCGALTRCPYGLARCGLNGAFCSACTDN